MYKHLSILSILLILIACGGGGGGSAGGDGNGNGNGDGNGNGITEPFDPNSQLDIQRHGVADLQLVPTITGDITFSWDTPIGLSDFTSINQSISHYNFSWSGSEQQTAQSQEMFLGTNYTASGFAADELVTFRIRVHYTGGHMTPVQELSARIPPFTVQQHGVADLQLVPAITGDITFSWDTPIGLSDFTSINESISHYSFSWSGSEQQTEQREENFQGTTYTAGGFAADELVTFRIRVHYTGGHITPVQELSARIPPFTVQQHGVASLQLVPAITGDITFSWDTPIGLSDFTSINESISHYDFSWSGSEQQTEQREENFQGTTYTAGGFAADELVTFRIRVHYTSGHMTPWQELSARIPPFTVQQHGVASLQLVPVITGDITFSWDTPIGLSDFTSINESISHYDFSWSGSEQQTEQREEMFLGTTYTASGFAADELVTFRIRVHYTSGHMTPWQELSARIPLFTADPIQNILVSAEPDEIRLQFNNPATIPTNWTYDRIEARFTLANGTSHQILLDNIDLQSAARQEVTIPYDQGFQDAGIQRTDIITQVHLIVFYQHQATAERSMETAVAIGEGITFFPDQDQDGITDSLDRDDDNDGLIEITTPQELSHIRYSLDGSGYKDGPDATKDTTGCPPAEEGGCHGYELVDDIDLTGYGDETQGWDPIGNTSDPFTARFDGNGHVISGLFIDRPAESDIGLFGGAADETISNVHLTEVNVSGDARIGGLVGSGTNFRIVSSSINGTVTGSNSYTGGLVGFIQGTIEISSSYMIGTVNGRGGNGGLIGGGGIGSGDVIIVSSAVIGNVNSVGTGGAFGFGGFVGLSDNVSISTSYMMGMVNGDSFWGGGLIGAVADSRVEDSYALGHVSGAATIVGGLIGRGVNIHLSSTYVAGTVHGRSNVGSLIADIELSVTSGEPSYWDRDLNGRTGTETAGTPQTTMTLQDSDADIYTSWTATCPNDDSIEVWDFGTDTEYPAINCSPFDPATQREFYQQHLDNSQQ